jgi:hypothetical protein
VAVAQRLMAKAAAERPDMTAVVAMLEPWDTGGPYPPHNDTVPNRLPPGLTPPPSSEVTTVLAPPSSTRPSARGESSRVSTAVREAAQRKIPKWAIALVGVAAVVAVVAAVMFSLPEPVKPVYVPRSTTTPFVGNYIPVTRTYLGNVSYPNGHNEFRTAGKLYPTIAEAITDPRMFSGDTCRILLLDDIHEEQVTIDCTNLPGGISIEPASISAPTLWIPPEEFDAKKPLISLVGGSRLSLKGLRFDGRNRVAHMLDWAKPGAGCGLSDITMQKFSRVGCTFTAVAGVAASPVLLTNVRIMPGAAAGIDGGVAISGGAAHMKLHGVRCDGPGRVGVSVQGEIDGFELFHARLSRLRTGLQLSAERTLAATVHSSTIADVPDALVVDRAPAKARLLVRNNVFARVQTALAWGGDVETSNAGAMLAGSAGNVCGPGDCSTKAVGLAVTPGPALDLGPDPASDSAYLRYAPDAWPIRAGDAGKPAGVPPR